MDRSAQPEMSFFQRNIPNVERPIVERFAVKSATT
jgi:hypothetical protein